MTRALCPIAITAALLLGCHKNPVGPDVATPTVSAVSPAQGTVGTEVRIDGSGFDSGAEVWFEGLQAPRVLRQGGSLFALAPSGLVPGTVYHVHVRNSGVQTDSATFTFRAVAPTVNRVNGATRPTGLRGMTLIVEGGAFGDSLGLNQAKVYFRAGDGSAVVAAIADSTNDWADGFVVTTVPQAIGDTSFLWVETPTGKSDSLEFRVIQSGVFSPSLINWTKTTPLPKPLHGLGALFVPVEHGASEANYVITVGGMDSLGAAAVDVNRAQVSQNGSLAATWSASPSLPEPRGYHAVVAATPFNAGVDTLTTAAFVYAIGGLDGAGQASDSVWYIPVGLDGAPVAWQSTTHLPKPLYAAAAAVFAGYVYLVGGEDTQGTPQSATYRARINDDGTLGPWQTSTPLPLPSSHGALVGFGPFLYAVGGDTGPNSLTAATISGVETSQVYLSRIDVRTRDLTAAGWSPTESMNKARAKHGAIFAGGAVFVTSGVYAGQPGSSENTYATIQSDGTLRPWQGATGAETIDAELGISLYSQAVVTFIDAAGFGHVLVLGGADRNNPGHPSAAVVRY